MSFLHHVLNVPFVDAIAWTGGYAVLGFVLGFTFHAIHWPAKGHPPELDVPAAMPERRS